MRLFEDLRIRLRSVLIYNQMQIVESVHLENFPAFMARAVTTGPI